MGKKKNNKEGKSNQSSNNVALKERDVIKNEEDKEKEVTNKKELKKENQKQETVKEKKTEKETKKENKNEKQEEVKEKVSEKPLKKQEEIRGKEAQKDNKKQEVNSEKTIKKQSEKTKSLKNKKTEKETEKTKTKNNEKNIKENETIEKNPKKDNTQNLKKEENKKQENDFEKVEFDTDTKKKKGIKFKIFIAFIIIILLALVLIATIPAIITRSTEKIVSGISINGIDAEGLTYEESKEKLNKMAEEALEKDIKIVLNEYENTINLSQISAEYDIDKAIEEAHNIGRESNILKSSYDVLIANSNGKDINLDVAFNSEEVNNLFSNISQEIPGHVVGWSYSVDNNYVLTITKGTKGIVIDEEETLKRIEEAMLSSFKGEDVEAIELAVREVEPDSIDVDKIHEEIYREPQNAYVTQDPFGVYVHVDGVDFNVDEVKSLVASDEQEYKIELTITEPEITTKELGQEAFPDVLGRTYKTTYSAGDKNRNTNIELAAKNVNGTILMPGETFSYNGILGDTTADKGYKPAGAYLNGEVIQSYGGGICQVSSTIYNAVLYADLEVTERYNHTYLSGYVPAGLDATVSYGSKDFKFTNNRDYPIKLVVTAGNGTISATIYGVKEDDDVDVELQSVITSYISPKVKYEKTNTLNEGEEKVKQAGSTGCKCTVYITKSKNGQEISREVLNNDVYSAKPKIILQGTKKVENTEKVESED